MIVTFRPAWTFTVGYLESSLNIALLVISVWSAYFIVLDSAGSADQLIANPFTPNAVANLICSAMVFGSSYLLHVHAARGSRVFGV
jgi:hypothetical protein